MHCLSWWCGSDAERSGYTLAHTGSTELCCIFWELWFAGGIEISSAFLALFVLVGAVLLCLTIALVCLVRRCNEPHSRSSAYESTPLCSKVTCVLLPAGQKCTNRTKRDLICARRNSSPLHLPIGSNGVSKAPENTALVEPLELVKDARPNEMQPRPQLSPVQFHPYESSLTLPRPTLPRLPSDHQVCADCRQWAALLSTT